MAELVDALDSKSGYRKVVQVRFLFWAQKQQFICCFFFAVVRIDFTRILVVPSVSYKGIFTTRDQFSLSYYYSRLHLLTRVIRHLYLLLTVVGMLKMTKHQLPTRYKDTLTYCNINQS